MPISQSHQTNPAAFDTLSYAKRLQGSGFTQEQAEIQAETFFNIIQDQLVSKRDLYDVEKNLRIEIENIKKDLAVEIEKVRKEFSFEIAKVRVEIEKVKTDLTIEIANVRKDLTVEIENVRKDLTVEIENVRKDLRFEISNLSKELKIWFGGMLVIVIGVLSGIMTLIVHLPN